MKDPLWFWQFPPSESNPGEAEENSGDIVPLLQDYSPKEEPKEEPNESRQPEKKSKKIEHPKEESKEERHLEELVYKYTKESTEYKEKIWELFCKIHELPPTTEYEEVGPDTRYVRKASLCWITDICDILTDNLDGHFIIRRKIQMLSF
jgi:hypothetical protein